MKRIHFLIIFSLLFFSFAFAITSCDKNETLVTANNTNDTPENNNTNNKMKVTIGTKVFTATLDNNATTIAFKAMLPLTLNMSELNGNEKFFYFSATLPTNASSAGTIETGDLMLYSNNCLVLFYEGFNTSYSYTRLGRIDNTSGLISALGSGSVTVKFELQ